MKKGTVFPCSQHLDGMAELFRNVVFACPDGKELKMQILCPWRKDKRYPLVVFVQGSAWTTPNPDYELPQLGALARQGFVVASVSHRDCRDGYAFPAFLQDVKTAIRFLRAHAAEYCIDKERVGIWGTSSGGNAALLVGMTGDWDCYRTEEYPEESDRVKAVVECFGPTDLAELVRGVMQEPAGDTDPRMIHLISDGKGGISPEKIRAMSPLYVAEGGREYPPFLMLHGDADPVVLWHQSEKLYEKLCALGYEAELVRVAGGVHENNFWTPELVAYVWDYLKERL